MSCFLHPFILLPPSFLDISPESATCFRGQLSSFVCCSCCALGRPGENQVHNFADGVTIGAAFLSCSTAIGWTVTASAILHEIPHELADFMALLNGGMSVKQVGTFLLPVLDPLLASLCLFARTAAAPLLCFALVFVLFGKEAVVWISSAFKG